LNYDQLQGAIFPLGDTRKEDVRKEATRRGLTVAQKPDSHDICFVPSGDNAGWLRERLGSEVGPIVDASGKKLGEHHGAYTYTIGQRRGLGISEPTPTGSPRYVLKIEPKTNTVVVGEHEELAVSEISGAKLIWCGPKNNASGPFRGLAQVRAHGSAYPCSYSVLGENLEVKLDSPIFGLATGQAVVIYEGDRVVCSATISRTA
jgi:tRNA-specific 2-thiouridylase